VVKICTSCGCLEPFNPHDDPRNITYYDMAQAAQAARVSIDEAAQNIQATCEMVNHPVKSIADLAQRPAILCDIDGVV